MRTAPAAAAASATALCSGRPAAAKPAIASSTHTPPPLKKNWLKPPLATSLPRRTMPWSCRIAAVWSSSASGWRIVSGTAVRIAT